MPEKTSKYKWPKTPGACADYGYKLRQQRLALNKEVEALDKEEKALKKHMFELLGRMGETGTTGYVGKFNMSAKDMPIIKDFDLVLKFAAKTIKGDMPYTSLIQRRLNAAMVNELWDKGKDVPGVETIEVLTGNFNKA